MITHVIVTALLLALTAGVAGAQTDAASQEALAAVLRMLRDPALRGGAIADSPQGRAADADVQALTRGVPALNQDVYELAAMIFEDLTRASGGDVGAMSQALSRAQADPTGFAATLSPRTLERLRALGAKLPEPPRR